MTATTATATAKREVREALKAAGITARVAASSTLINVTLTDKADAPAALKALPGAYVADYSPKLVLVRR
jgi:hypothetical protein